MKASRVELMPVGVMGCQLRLSCQNISGHSVMSARCPLYPRKRTLVVTVGSARKAGFRRELGLLDYVRNYVLRRYDHDLILGDKEFVCSDLRYLLGHERWKGLQFDIWWYFLADPDLAAAGHLLDMHVLQHYFF